MSRRFAVPQPIMDAFLAIEPEKTFETKIVRVLRKGSIYILLPKLFNRVYFIRLFNQTPSQEKKLRLPFFLMRKKYFKDEISGFPVAKARGEFTILFDAIKRSERNVEEKYVRGQGVMYLVPRYDMRQRRYLVAPDISDKLDKTVILDIIEELSKETIETGAGI
nr:hypothetical protein [Candidatus Njordarchaeota archaeon]